MPRRLLTVCLAAAGFAAGAQAQHRFLPPRAVEVCPPSVLPACPPVGPATPLPLNPDGTPNTSPTAPLGDPGAGGGPAPNLNSPAQNTLGALNEPFAQQTGAGASATASLDQNTNGDFGGVFYTRRELVPVARTTVVGFTERVTGVIETVSIDANGNKVVTRTPVVVRDPVLRTETVNEERVVRIPLAARYASVKIVENDNPRPQDRVYFGYNFYSRVNAGQNPGLGGVDLQRQTIGFEKTLLDGNASFGMRLPFVQVHGDGSIDTGNVGDLSFVFKYAFVNAPGSVRSVGMVVTAPTGNGGGTLLDGREAPHSTLLQPWAGFVETIGRRGYATGFSSVIVPTDSRDPLLFCNSLALGYWLTRHETNGRYTGIVPTTELHINTPLNHRGPDNLIYINDQVNMTNGVNFVLPRATVSVALCTPLAGPLPWRAELLVLLNWRF